MSTNMFTVTVPIFIKMLSNLKEILKEGEAYAERAGIDPNTLPVSYTHLDVYKRQLLQMHHLL